MRAQGVVGHRSLFDRLSVFRQLFGREYRIILGKVPLVMALCNLAARDDVARQAAVLVNDLTVFLDAVALRVRDASEVERRRRRAMSGDAWNEEREAVITCPRDLDLTVDDFSLRFGQRSHSNGRQRHDG